MRDSAFHKMFTIVKTCKRKGRSKISLETERRLIEYINKKKCSKIQPLVSAKG